jgi:Helix-turn-helix domain
MVDDDPLLDKDEAAHVCHVLPETMTAWRCAGRGPRYVKIGRRVFYRESALRDWLRVQERDPAVKRQHAAA